MIYEMTYMKRWWPFAVPALVCAPCVLASGGGGAVVGAVIAGGGGVGLVSAALIVGGTIGVAMLGAAIYVRRRRVCASVKQPEI